MKTMSFPGADVKDLGGLYYELLKEHFAVENVGRGRDCTLVYLEDQEEKDPTPFVEEWTKKPAFPNTRSAIDDRRKGVVKIVENARKEKAEREAVRAREAAERQAQEMEASRTDLAPAGNVFDLFPAPALGGSGGQAAPQAKPSFISKIFKVFKKA
jgi:hypothetical protein